MKLMNLAATILALAGTAIAPRAQAAYGDLSVSFTTRSGECVNTFSLSKEGDEFLVHGDGCFRDPGFQPSGNLKNHNSFNYQISGMNPNRITVIDSVGSRKVIDRTKDRASFAQAVTNMRTLSRLIIAQADNQGDRTAKPNSQLIVKKLNKALSIRYRLGN